MSARGKRAAPGAAAGPPDASLWARPDDAPLAARMRPRTLDEFAGQRHLLAPGKPLRDAIEAGDGGVDGVLGAAGVGQDHARAADRPAHRARVRLLLGGHRRRAARARDRGRGAEPAGAGPGHDPVRRRDPPVQPSQQDAFLPHVESGTITLVGATTENPSFEINGALLSRTRVFVLQPLSAEDLRAVVRAALADAERGLGGWRLAVDDAAVALIAAEADGDARRALTVLEAAASHVGKGGAIGETEAREAMQLRFAHFDKGGEEAYNMLSAYHKSLRGSDPQGALYWMARMIEGGADPMTLFRRAIAMAAEDIGLADPAALELAVAARDAFHLLGAPEGYLRSPRRPCIWPRRPSRTAPCARWARRSRRPGPRRRSRCRCTSATRRPV